MALITLPRPSSVDLRTPALASPRRGLLLEGPLPPSVVVDVARLLPNDRCNTGEGGVEYSEGKKGSVENVIRQAGERTVVRFDGRLVELLHVQREKKSSWFTVFNGCNRRQGSS